MNKLLQKVGNFNTIRFKITSFAVLLLTFLLIQSFSVQLITGNMGKNLDVLFQQSIKLGQVEELLEGIEDQLEEYLSTKDSDSFVNYLGYVNDLKTYQQTLFEEYDQGLRSSAEYLIGNMIDEYVRKTEEAIEEKRARNPEGYLPAAEEAAQISSYIVEQMDFVVEKEFYANLDDYQEMSAYFEKLRMAMLIMTGIIFLLSLIFIYDLTKEIIEPIDDLTYYANKISSGAYEMNPAHGKAYYEEAKVLRNTFYEMTLNIQKYVEELKGKSAMEKKIQENELEKLRFKHLLSEAELKAMQSQINPHFLFNTLNAGVQLATLEDASKTGQFLMELSSIFRYNIQKLNNQVSLQDEVSNLKSYLHLMKVRYGNELNIYFDLDPKTLDLAMPPLILQPFVENAIIHGFKGMSIPGVIQLSATCTPQGVVLIIQDNGIGFSPEVLAAYQRKDFEAISERAGHSTGLGVTNVLERLHHFYQGQVSVSFYNDEGAVIEVVIRSNLCTES